MRKIKSLQLLRGLAATLVAAFHLHEAAINEGHLDTLFVWFSQGHFGVDLFFVISGFIIYVTAKNRNQTLKEFLFLRFMRIFPPYWVILTLYIAAAIGAFLAFGDASKLPTLDVLVTSYLLLPAPDHVINIAWTLVIELLFYVVFALSFLRFGERAFFIAMIIWVSVSQIYVQMALLHHPTLDILLHRAVMEFLFGAAVGHLFLKGISAGRFLALGVGILLTLCYLGNISTQWGLGREIVAGIPAALVIYGAANIDMRLGTKTLLWGESSYVLYLLHILVYSLIGRAVEVFLSINPYHSDIWMVFMLALVTCLSYYSCKHLERPYQDWYQGRFRRRRQHHDLATSRS